MKNKKWMKKNWDFPNSLIFFFILAEYVACRINWAATTTLILKCNTFTVNSLPSDFNDSWKRQPTIRRLLAAICVCVLLIKSLDLVESGVYRIHTLSSSAVIYQFAFLLLLYQSKAAHKYKWSVKIKWEKQKR